MATGLRGFADCAMSKLASGSLRKAHRWSFIEPPAFAGGRSLLRPQTRAKQAVLSAAQGGANEAAGEPWQAMASMLGRRLISDCGALRL